MSANAVRLETLEPRRLLALALNVNFQPPGAATPAGYLADIGAPYANRGNGYSYGWNASATSTMRDRHASSDQRYDTLVHTQMFGTRTWEAAVPNGTYNLRIVAGDPSYSDSTIRFAAENVIVAEGKPSASSRYIDATKTITVSDGRLTISNASGASNNKLCFVQITSSSAPPASLDVPGTIQAEDFGSGGKNVSYYDTTGGNNGGLYRATDVDIGAASEGGYFIGWTRPGEWLKYSINVKTTGTYTLELRYAVGNSGGNVHVEVDGANKTGTMTLANTGGWQAWKTISKGGISLTAGSHTLRLAFDSAASSGNDIGNINYLRLTLNSTAPTWSGAAPSPVARFEANNAAVNGKLYVFGGYDKNISAFTASHVYDPQANTWKSIAAMPEALTHSGVATDGGDIYIAGGFVGAGSGAVSRSVWKYSATSNQWTRMTSLPDERAAGGMVRIGRKLHFFGGSEAHYHDDHSDHWVLDLDNPAAWTSAPAMPNPRNHFGYAELNGKIYVIGGQYLHNENTGNVADVNVYDPAKGSWSSAAPLPRARSHNHTATFIRNGKIVVVGGQANGTPSAAVTIADVSEFDPVQNKWNALTPLPSPRQACVAKIINGTIIVTTGTPQGINPQSNTWIMR